MSVSLPLKIDRIHMTIAVPSKTLYSFFLGQLYGMKDIQSDLCPNGNLKLNKNKGFTSLYISPSPNRRIAELTVGTTKSKHSYFKLGLYPAKLRPGELDMLNGWLKILMDDLSVEYFLTNANVSYLELAWDFFNKDNAAFLPYSPKARRSYVCDDKSAHKGGQYVGSVGSDRRFCFYDKARQLKEVYGVTDFNRLARVEVRLKKTGLKAIELLEKLENPFLHLEFLSVQTLREAASDKPWQSFINDCEIRGVALPLWACDKATRKLYQSRLAAAKVQWWDPSKAWVTWPKAFSAILPSDLLFLQSIAGES